MPARVTHSDQVRGPRRPSEIGPGRLSPYLRDRCGAGSRYPVPYPSRRGGIIAAVLVVAGGLAIGAPVVTTVAAPLRAIAVAVVTARVT